MFTHIDVKHLFHQWLLAFSAKHFVKLRKFLYPALLGLMKHQRVVRGQGHIETTLEVYREWALLIGQEPSRQWCKG